MRYTSQSTSHDHFNSVSAAFILSTAIGVVILSYLYYLVAVLINPHHMSYINCLVFSTILSLSILGGFQLYFWAQYNCLRKPVSLKIKLDDYFPFYPSWTFCYIFINYISLGLVVVVIQNLEEGVHILFGGLILLLIHCVIFVFFPVAVPDSYRIYQANTLSTKLLKFVQVFDNGSNCFPSMHCAFVTYLAFFLIPTFGSYAYVLIVLIALSCLFTKQHYVLDILPGIFLGWAGYIFTARVLIGT